MTESRWILFLIFKNGYPLKKIELYLHVIFNLCDSVAISLKILLILYRIYYLHYPVSFLSSNLNRINQFFKRIENSSKDCGHNLIKKSLNDISKNIPIQAMSLFVKNLLQFFYKLKRSLSIIPDVYGNIFKNNYKDGTAVDRHVTSTTFTQEGIIVSHANITRSLRFIFRLQE